MQFKKNMLTAFFLMLTALMLSYSQESLYFALTGLKLWFLKMIPTLLPFMILSGIMVRMNLTEGFVSLFYPILYPVFRLGRNAAYCIIMGFLCGFPMGAKVISELYERDRLSRWEAEWLLSFCNNIGPIYFVSFVLPALGTSKLFPYLFGMYGLPLLYGIFLRYTQYAHTIPIRSATAPTASPGKEQKLPLLYYVDDAINAAAAGITGLGGYMILFNLLNLAPYAIFLKLKLMNNAAESFLAVFNGFLEITSGISRMGSSFPFMVLLLLPFGGLSCIAQTYSIIKKTNLSLQKYVMHKSILTLITFLYYLLWYVVSPLTFLT